jgi:hypothetical protein
VSGPDSGSAANEPWETPAPDEAVVRVIRNHRRFALSEVTLDGQPVGGATIDTWENGAGAQRWSARVLMPAGDGRDTGVLAGRRRDGSVVRGSGALIGPGPALRGRGSVMTEWHGITALRPDSDPGDAEAES